MWKGKNVNFTLKQAMKAQRELTLSLTMVLDGSGWSMPWPDHTTPQETDAVPIVQESEWVHWPVWIGGENHFDKMCKIKVTE